MDTRYIVFFKTLPFATWNGTLTWFPFRPHPGYCFYWRWRSGWNIYFWYSTFPMENEPRARLIARHKANSEVSCIDDVRKSIRVRIVYLSWVLHKNCENIKKYFLKMSKFWNSKYSESKIENIKNIKTIFWNWMFCKINKSWKRQC